MIINANLKEILRSIIDPKKRMLLDTNYFDILFTSLH